MFIVSFGDIIQGYTFYGPFDTRANAQLFAENDGIVTRLKVAARAIGNGSDLAQGQLTAPQFSQHFARKG